MEKQFDFSEELETLAQSFTGLTIQINRAAMDNEDTSPETRRLWAAYSLAEYMNEDLGQMCEDARKVENNPAISIFPSFMEEYASRLDSLYHLLRDAGATPDGYNLADACADYCGLILARFDDLTAKAKAATV